MQSVTFILDEHIEGIVALIILEGSDQAGKSTIAHAINRQLRKIYPDDNIEILHAGPPQYHPLDEYERPLFAYRPLQQHHIICDRWHIGESVFPAIFHRSTQFTQSVHAHVEAFLHSRGAVLVHAHAHPDVLTQRFILEQREHPGVSLVNLDQLLISHERFFDETCRSTLPCIEVDTTDTTISNLNDAIRNILERATMAEYDTYSLANFHTYVGESYPNILFVGDVRNEHRFVHHDDITFQRAQLDQSPAFMPYPASSNEYFLRIIEPLLHKYRIGFIYANDVDDAYAAWKILGEPRAIALGQWAYNATCSWVHGAVPCHKYIHQFYNNHITWYNQCIEQAMHGANILAERPPII